MSHFSDFMEGVPVKVSERYKRPPQIEVPYSVHECTSRAQNALDNVRYCSTFESNVLAKLKELRSAKETKKNERKHRVQLLEEAKQRKLDAIAAVEAQEKLKQLSVSDVSYPSTEEISEISPDDKNDKDTTLTQDEDIGIQTDDTANNDVVYPTCSNQEEDPNILKPIQVQTNYHSNSLLDDPDPLETLKMQTKSAQIPQYYPNFGKRNVDTMTYKDFENDTSSPFDNVELKTINDMELLAQVLQSQKDSNTSCNPHQQYLPEQMYNMPPNCATQAQSECMTYLPNSYTEQTVQGPQMYTSPEHYPVTNGYYIPAENCDNRLPVDNMYMPNYQYYVPSNPYPANANYYNQPLATEPVEPNQILKESNYIPHPYYFNYPQVPYQYPSAYNSSLPTPANETINPQSSETFPQPQGSQQTIKSRSRSVPDIVRELNEELASAKLRANERSYNASPAPKDIPRSSSSIDKKFDKQSRRKSEQLPNPYEKLSPKLQSMCQRIHCMGFPLDRVARVCTLIGDSDKKIIEGLLIMGELLDLGFPEGKVSAALAKHEFSKEKALDELVP